MLSGCLGIFLVTKPLHHRHEEELLFPPLPEDTLKATVPGPAPSTASRGLEHSTSLAGVLRPLFAGLATCFCLAIHLLELKAFIAVAVALGVAKVIAGRGPAALLGGLFRSRLSPVGPSTHPLAEVLALHTELFAAAGQDVLAGGPGTFGP